jgi:hypothetical protein
MVTLLLTYLSLFSRPTWQLMAVIAHHHLPQAGQDGELLYWIGSFGTSDEIDRSSDISHPSRSPTASSRTTQCRCESVVTIPDRNKQTNMLNSSYIDRSPIFTEKKIFRSSYIPTKFWSYDIIQPYSQH